MLFAVDCGGGELIRWILCVLGKNKEKKVRSCLTAGQCGIMRLLTNVR